MFKVTDKGLIFKGININLNFGNTTYENTQKGMNRLQTENSLLICRPHIAKYWHPSRNLPLTPTEVSKGSGINVWWICDNGHEYNMAVNNRVKKTKICPYCSNKRVHDSNSLYALAPEIANQWNPTKNGIFTPKNIHRNSNKTYWWICDSGHEYEMRAVYKRTTSCPYCIGKRVSKNNSLAVLKPNIAQQWHPNKNVSVK